MFLWLLFAGALPSSLSLIIKNPVTVTKYGSVLGTWGVSRSNKTYSAFIGIPYAKPPIEDLRFANPEPPETWIGTYNATYYRPRCIQRNYIFTQNPAVEGSEDCLYLNIYVPEELARKKRELPVMVGIHWGGFFAGGADDGYLGPEYFMDYGIILVTFNYRLGIFGFLSTLDDSAPGNYGLKDQVMALQWVKENIELFGGLPDKVTIFGQSAGAASVHLHYISEASNGLFSKGISQSGTALSPWAYSTNEVQLYVTNIQAQLVNCTSAAGNTTEIVNCLRNTSADVLLNTQDNFKFFHNLPYTVWSTVVENKTVKNPKPFLTEYQSDALENGRFKRLPWLMGGVPHEGLLLAASLLSIPSELDDLNSNFNATMAKLLVTTENSTLYNRIFSYYLRGQNYLDVNDSVSVENFVNLFSDKYFQQPLYESLKFHIENGHHSIYLYSFEYSGENTYAKYFSTDSSHYSFNLGATHCDDLLYQFRTPELFSDLSKGHDVDLSGTMLKLWTNFAKHGNPNPKDDPVLSDIDWQTLAANNFGSLSNTDVALLNITGSYQTGSKFTITEGFYPERLQFWESVLNK